MGLEPFIAVRARKFQQKRKGAHAVNTFDKDAIGTDGKLDRDKAMTFRAMWAHG